MINRINILPPEIYNKIAAGEVVEHPASALKEVVENSIDAGAHRIVIEVCNGGFDLISVTDNGSGIYEEDLPAVFVKHATSKLECAEDLELIQTLGFRGEALSSIAAVSRVKMTTRQVYSDTGVCITVEDGKIVSQEYVTANVGTKVEIRDLFYNTPARKKFMKTAAREGSEITKFVSKLILTNPNLEMTYILDGKTVYHTTGNGLPEAIFTVYGSECLENCLSVNYQVENIRITGYIGNPEYTKPNTTYQTLSVNGRCVQDKSIQAAITQAFKPYLMTRQYPMFVLDVELPFDVVDVNVHPRKTEVRFQNHQLICGKFFRAVEAALNEYKSVKVKDIWDLPGEEEEVPYDPEYGKCDLLKGITEMTAEQVKDILEIEEQTKLANKQSLRDFALELEKTVSVEKARKALGIDENGTRQDLTLTFYAPDPPPKEEKVYDLGDDLLSRTRVLGSAFKTYLILEMDDKMILVDQHAAHERILFDKFMQANKAEMQPLLFPYVFHVKDEEAEFIERNLDNILQAGFEVQPFGPNTYRICAVMPLLEDVEMADFVKYLLSSINEFSVDNTLIVEKIAQKACKAAVKAGQMLNELEIKYILKAVYQNEILQCPHGRPITVVFSKNQLEKMFKRIV